MDPLTYLDYLAYIPMFLDIHSSVVQNPFNQGGMSKIRAVEGGENGGSTGKQIRVPNPKEEKEARISIFGAQTRKVPIAPAVSAMARSPKEKSPSALRNARTSSIGGYGGEQGGMKKSLVERSSVARDMPRKKGMKRSPSNLGNLAE